MHRWAGSQVACKPRRRAGRHAAGHGRHACGRSLPGRARPPSLAPVGCRRPRRRLSVVRIARRARPPGPSVAGRAPTPRARPGHPHRCPRPLARWGARPHAGTRPFTPRRGRRSRFLPLPRLARRPGGLVSIFGERGIIDLLPLHPATGSLLVIELKTAIIDVNELAGTLDRKTRLALRIAAERGWRAQTVSRWVVVSRSSTNSRRIAAHRSVLRAAFPGDGRAARGRLSEPSGAIGALSTWSSTNRGGRRRSSVPRVRPASSG